LTGVAHVYILFVVLDDWDEEDLAMLHALRRVNRTESELRAR
jgi:hypothetical protein